MYKIVVGSTERKIQLVRRRLSWENNIKMELREIGLKVLA